MLQKIHTVIKNKVVGYVATRYLTLGVQFLNSILIAAILGPAYLAVWGFINLVLQYAAQLNFGIPHSLNVQLSINKDNDEVSTGLINAAVFSYLLLGVVFVLLIAGCKALGIEFGEKYNFSAYVIPVFFIAILTHFNTLFTNYFRVRNRLKEIIFFQSIIPLATLVVLFVIKDEERLISALLAVMLVGQIASTVIFLFSLDIKISFNLPKISPYMQLLLRRGFYLFIYNACFYYIIISTRSVVSAYYDVIEFGYFTFSFTLANAIMLLFDSFSFLIYPKIINRLNQRDQKQTTAILSYIRNGYIVAIHLIMYSFILFYPLLIMLFPAYQEEFKCFALIVMSLVFYSNCFIYSSVLTANSREKQLGGIAFIILILNIALALCIALVFKWSYEYVVLATLVAYFVYNILLTIPSNGLMNIKNSFKTIFVDNFPLSLFIPFGLCLLFVVTDQPHYVYWIVFLLFLVLNFKKIKNLAAIVQRILKDPKIINI